MRPGREGIGEEPRGGGIPPLDPAQIGEIEAFGGVGDPGLSPEEAGSRPPRQQALATLDFLDHTGAQV